MTFVCAREAVYLHDVVGPFATYEDAVAECQRLADEEPDGCHNWYVATLGMNGLMRLDERAFTLTGPNKPQHWSVYTLPYTKRTP